MVGPLWTAGRRIIIVHDGNNINDDNNNDDNKNDGNSYVLLLARVSPPGSGGRFSDS